MNQNKTRVFAMFTSALLYWIAISTVASADVNQTTHGWCSPTIHDTTGKIDLTCAGVDPQLVLELKNLIEVHLESLIKRTDIEIERKNAEIDEWVERYLNIVSRVSELNASQEVISQLETLIRGGNFSNAERILQSMEIGQKENDIAKINFLKAELNRQQFKLEGAIEGYKKACVIQPDIHVYCLGYANVLREVGEGSSALGAYEEILSRLREGGQAADLAYVLNNLGVLRIEHHDFGGAVDALMESVTLYQGLAQRVPEMYAFELTTTLTNLGDALTSSGRIDDAIISYSEAEDVYAAHCCQDDARVRNLGKLRKLYFQEGNIEKYSELSRSIQQIQSESDADSDRDESQ
jgi:tetratricopeptide (TPR) repeat protein